MLAAALLLGACIAVDRDTVQLSDLLPQAPPEAAGLSLGYAPVAGARRQFTASALNDLLTRHGLPLYQGGDLCVERSGRRLDPAGVKQALARALANPQAELEIAALDPRLLPAGALEFPLSGLAPPSPLHPEAPALWRGRLRAGPHQSIPVWVKVHLRVPVTRLFALETLPAGALIQAGQLRSQLVWERMPAEGEALSPGQVQGFRLKRAIQAGEALKAQWLEAPFLVRRGESVRAHSRRDGVEIRLETTAESDGRKGDRVKIRSPFGNGTLTAVVESEGSVAIVAGGATR